MDFGLLSLPPEILAKIFSYITWNELVNVKLSARKFYFVTEKYLKDMQKPKLCRIKFLNGCFPDDYKDRIKITFSILITSANRIEDINEIEKELRLLPSELGQLNSFLQKVDLTLLNYLDFSLDNYTKVMQIFSDYFNNPNIMDSIHVDVTIFRKDPGNTLSFLQKIQKVKKLKLDLRFPYIKISRDFIIPVKNSLLELEIEESLNTAFINPRMINYFVENNPNLTSYYLCYEKFGPLKMVIETIAKAELSRRNNGCFHREIFIRIEYGTDEILFALIRYFYSEQFPYKSRYVQPGVILYKGKSKCPVCGEFDIIAIANY
uniref:F-box domain-containing protein n=1 Tax=Strongyloides venezuelensis TaxID=75913 RepID=A0A0K0EWE2_STRVS